jgi:type I restriction enzyme S subunit
MKKYNSYKDSGVEWIGEIPSHWSKIKIKNTVDPNRKITYGIVQPGEEDPNGILMIRGKDYSNGWVDISEVFRVSPEIESPYSRSRVKTGDIVYTIVGGVGNVEMVPKEYDGSNLTQTTGRISVKDGINPKWIYFCFQSELNSVQIKLCQVGSVIPGISLETLKNFIVLLPTLTEQSQIVSFLDTKTSLIDSLIEKTQRKIELLKEKRTSLINEVVTKGLNPNVEMKDSGVEWIGEIPISWITSKLGFYTTKIGSGSTPRGGSEVYVDSGIPFIRSQNVHFDGLRLDDVSFIEYEVHNSMKGSTVVKSDVLLNITGGSIGRCCVVEIEGEMNVNQHVSIIRTTHGLVNYFLNYILSCDLGQSQVRYNLTGGNREGLTIEGIRDFQITIPPLSEQNEIVSFLDEHTQLIDKTISIEEKRIELLKEYRQSLISEVVTGKRKVVD